MSLFAMSDAFRAAAVSRRSRLDFIDATVLMRLTRVQLFRLTWPALRVLSVVRSLATRGCEEAGWLLAMLGSERPRLVIEELGSLLVVSCEWLAEIIAREDSPRAWFYRVQLLRFRVDAPDEEMVDLLRRAAEAGFAPAMTSLASELSGDERLSWLRKAAALHDPGALSVLARLDQPNRFALRLEAANLGDTESMEWLAKSSESGLSLQQRAAWLARAQFLGVGGAEIPGVLDALGRMAARGLFEEDVLLVHAVGRELEGIEKLKKDATLGLKHRKCVDFYLWIVHTARRAALQMIVAMRELRMPRDVAILIARLVYDSRDDVVAWCESGQIARRRLNKKNM